MERYKDLGGNSGIATYAITADAITIQFKDGGVYVYDYTSPGVQEVEAMKQLALRGKGLATYINRHSRKTYARKLAAIT